MSIFKNGDTAWIQTRYDKKFEDHHFRGFIGDNKKIHLAVQVLRPNLTKARLKKEIQEYVLKNKDAHLKEILDLVFGDLK